MLIDLSDGIRASCHSQGSSLSELEQQQIDSASALQTCNHRSPEVPPI